ncbi:MAG: tRNA (adenosine(37)-N6)-threonylcarbamoyltransferase complex ATPase subunit type 1 TsaE [Candidatus Pelagadaptatus aseana]|uniref:tRNA (adenosine(37)-N6)-threonylcarbamoyltransferase complex ATPase subunit type 1 TsaE n=1 Tax=Candidatus Pelagadaptatus aseana TaxID=3120508 RepID=UPI0039B18BCB
MSKEFYLADEEQTVAFGRNLGEACRAQGQGGVIFMLGDLGAGKTTTTRGVLRAYGHEGAVKSPTYTLVEPYELAQDAWVYHFDLYRLGEPEELEYMGIRDYFDAGNLCLVEWPNRGEGYLPQADLLVNLSVSAPGRKVSVTAQTDLGQQLLQCL